MNQTKINIKFLILGIFVLSLILLLYFREIIVNKIPSVERAFKMELEEMVDNQLIAISNSKFGTKEIGTANKFKSSRKSSEPNNISLPQSQKSLNYSSLIVSTINYHLDMNEVIIDSTLNINQIYGNLDSTSIKEILLPFCIIDSLYVNRIPRSKNHFHSILTTNAIAIENEKDLFYIYAKIQFEDSTAFHGAYLLYYPLQGLPNLATNFLVLIVIFLILYFAYKKDWIVSRRFYRYFQRAVFFMIVIYATFLLPGIFQWLGKLFPKASSLSELARILPDDAFFLYAGLCLLSSERLSKGLLGWLIAIHVLTILPQYFNEVPIAFGNRPLFLSDKLPMSEFPPQLYAFVSCVIIGIGIFRQGYSKIKSLPMNPSEFYEWFTIGLCISFIAYGLFQLFYPYISKELFFSVILPAKIVTFTGVLLFNNMELILNKFINSYKIEETIIDYVPQPTIVFSDDGKLKRVSKKGLEILNMNASKNLIIKDILADDVECDFLHRIKSAKLKKDYFLLDLKDSQNKKITFMASYVPFEDSTHLLTLTQLDKAVITEIADSIQTHRVKGRITSALKFLQMLGQFIKENYGFAQIDTNDYYTGIKINLEEIQKKLKEKESPYSERSLQTNVASLNKIMDRIREDIKQKCFGNIEISFENSLTDDIKVRHDEDMLYANIRELLTNSGKKFVTKTEKGKAEIKFEISSEFEDIKIIVKDFGDPIKKDSPKYLKYLETIPSFLHTPRSGLESIKSNMMIFGGDLIGQNDSWENREIPKFTIILIKAGAVKCPPNTN